MVQLARCALCDAEYKARVMGEGRILDLEAKAVEAERVAMDAASRLEQARDVIKGLTELSNTQRVR